MSIHIGNIIQEEVKCKQLTQKEFGALIHKNEKTVPDIYDRATMSIDLLITISVALNKDFLSVFYLEEPMKSLRNDEILELNLQIQKICDERLDYYIIMHNHTLWMAFLLTTKFN